MDNEILDKNQLTALNRYAYSRIIEAWDCNSREGKDTPLRESCRRIFLENLPGTTVLDAACGTGIDSQIFAEHGMAVTAIDIVYEFAVSAQKKDRRITSAVMDLHSLCFAPESFKGIYCFAGLIHVHRPELLSVLAAFWRILGPGGLILIHHTASNKGYKTYCVENLIINGNPAYCSCHDEAEFVGLLKEAGFARCTVLHTIHQEKKSETALEYGLEPYQIIAFRD